MKKIIVRSPGRMCVLGEHQDYFNLPVICAGINRYITIEIEQRNDATCEVICKDTNEHYKFNVNDIPLQYTKERDYIKSVINTVANKSNGFQYGFTPLIYGDIPFKGGLSSSSALCVAFSAGLSYLYSNTLPSPKELALLGFTSEVLEFNEHGGMMDHISSAHGGIMHIDFKESDPTISKLHINSSDFIIADSNEPKNTAITGLAKIKSGVNRALEIIIKENPHLNIHNIKIEHVEKFDSILPIDRQLLIGTLKTRDITADGFLLLRNKNYKPQDLGSLIANQHAVLRDNLEISTQKIEKIIKESIRNGALGCKIIGSGGGGCVLIYAPGHIDTVRESIIQSGGIPINISISEGTHVL